MADSGFETSPLSSTVAPEAAVARDRDLGFGSVIGRDSRARLLNRDGTFNVRRTGLGLLGALAPYHQLLAVSWPGFLGFVIVVYFVCNLIFAVAFVLCGDQSLLGPGAEMLGGRFARAFFFSVQTFATIGYGQIGPNGFAANAVVTVEALIGLMYQALATGLLFARFARPTAAIIFSRNALIAPYDGGLSLQFRIANKRLNQIIELEAQVLFSSMQPDGRGGKARRYTALPLERNKVTFFPLSWTIVHPIDAASPFAGQTPAQLESMEAEILVLLSGVDETFEQTVHARSSYRPDELVWHARFKSPFTTSPEGGVTLDLGRLHDTEAI